jgi:hypothetical protein
MVSPLPRRSRSLVAAGKTTRGRARHLWSLLRPTVAPGAALLLGACAFIEQYPDPAPDPPGSGGTTGTTGTSSNHGGGGASTTGGGMGGSTITTTTSTTTGSGAGGAGGGGGSTTTTTATTGTGGAGGSAGCAPMSTEPCYTGPEATRHKGICMDGVATCTPQGVFGPCLGQVLPAIEDCAAPADEDCDGQSPPCSVGTLLWAKRFGDLADQAGSSIAADADGSAILAGAFSGTVDFGGLPLVSQGPSDAYVAKLDALGQHAWSKRFGNAGTESCAGVAVDGAGNVTIVGQFSSVINFGQGPIPSGGQSDIFLAHFTSAGGIIWGNGYGNVANQLSNAVATNAQGDLLVGGRLEGSLDFGIGLLTGLGGGDVLAAKFSPAGTPMWSKSFGDAQLQVATATAIDGAGNLVIAGVYKGVVDFGLGALPNAAALSLFVVKFDPTGVPLWNKAFPGAFSVLFSRSIATDAQGNVVVFGRLNGSADFGGGVRSSIGPADNLFLIKLDPQGNHLWSQVHGGVGVDFDGGAAVDPWGNIVITGGFESQLSFGGPTMFSAGMEDLFVAKLDGAGNHLWSYSWGDPLVQSGRGVAIDGKGNVLVAGVLAGGVDFGFGPLLSAGGTDMLVLKLAP